MILMELCQQVDQVNALNCAIDVLRYLTITGYYCLQADVNSASETDGQTTMYALC